MYKQLAKNCPAAAAVLHRIRHNCREGSPVVNTDEIRVNAREKTWVEHDGVTGGTKGNKSTGKSSREWVD